MRRGDRHVAFRPLAHHIDGVGAQRRLGIPYWNEPTVADSGRETVLYGSFFSDGFEGGSTLEWSVTEPRGSGGAFALGSSSGTSRMHPNSGPRPVSQQRKFSLATIRLAVSNS